MEDPGMFNLIVKGTPWREGHDRIDAGRVFEYTEDALKLRFMPEGELDFDALMAIPTILVQETSGEPDRVARVAQIHRVRRDSRNILLDYSYDTSIAAIPNGRFHQFASELGIQDFEFERVHWAVKDADLYRALLRHTQAPRQRPNVFDIPDFENVDSRLVSAMMPFDAAFNKVYSTIQTAAEQAGFHCSRADDIWENPAIIQDVISLIERSSVVICDCTNRNPNVFYEIGVAHTLGRDVIIVTQTGADIPFDLRHLRYVSYLNNAQGRRALSTSLVAKLREIAASRNG
jgi:hypothetical protein